MTKRELARQLRAMNNYNPKIRTVDFERIIRDIALLEGTNRVKDANDWYDVALLYEHSVVMNSIGAAASKFARIGWNKLGKKK